MNELQAASILDPNTRREALQPYELDCVARLAAVEEACQVAARTLRLTHNSGPLMIDTSILSDEQFKHLLEEKGKAEQYPLRILPGNFGRPDKPGPLTLEQLQEMVGEPVWVKPKDAKEYADVAGWCVCLDGEVQIPGCECFSWRFENYGITWIAYAYPPAHVDREALCGEWQGEADGYADGNLVYDYWRCGDCGHVEETDDPDLLPNFCPDCGLAMTEKAWSMLEKRLRGMKV